MKINETNCSVTYIPRSIKNMYQFQESSCSKTDLDWMAELKHVDSGLKSQKQKFFNACTNEWSKVWVLIVHDLAQISICHCWTHLQQFQKLARNQWILPLTTSIMHRDEGLIKILARFVKKNEEKLREKVEELLDLDLNFQILLWLAMKQLWFSFYMWC